MIRNHKIMSNTDYAILLCSKNSTDVSNFWHLSDK